MSAPRYRPARFGGSTNATFETRADGAIIVRCAEPLGDYPERFGECLVRGAAAHPDRLLVAQRDAQGDWRRISWAQALATARSLAQALLDRGLSADRPLMILSDNDIEQFLLTMAGYLCGVPVAPVSAAYSLVSQDYGKLRHIHALTTPGLVFASKASAFAGAFQAVVPPETELVVTEGADHPALAGRRVTSFATLAATPATAAVDAAYAATGPDTIAKFLFTSGSTKLPKGVANTHRMLCANQQTIAQCMLFVTEEPPVLLDWLPWSHTFGGNHNVGIVLYNGGSLYIDGGKPTPALIGETLRNLREIAPTAYFNVPKGYEEISAAMEHDETLRATLFSRTKMLFYSGAGLSQQVWDRLMEHADAAVGERVRMVTSLGMTETAPFVLFPRVESLRAGHVGLPGPGNELKLVPTAGKMEVRYRGPNVMPGYWRNPEQTAEAFDEEGWFCSGDALKFIDPADPGQGLAFDGRIAEDFKLSSGTFVSVGPLRAKVIAVGAPCVQDAVVTGLNRDEMGLLLLPRWDDCRRLAGLSAAASPAEIAAAPEVCAFFQQLVDTLHAQATGSATRVSRAVLMVEPLSIDKGEVTDKGSLNQRAVLTHREALVDALYAGTAPGLLLPSVAR